MNYLQWNNAIINHYFNTDNEDKEVILYFSERVIEEIGRNNFEEPEGGYIQDFYRALKQGVPGTTELNYVDKILYLEEKHNKGIIKIDNIPLLYPPYLAYFIAFILPFTSGETVEVFNSNNFYGYINTFFKEKGLIPDNYSFNTSSFIEIDKLWKRINDWLVEKNNFQLGYLEEVSPPEKRKYVGKFAYHILFRKEQEEKLSTIFDKEDLLPNETIDERRIKEILLSHARELQLKEKTIKKIKDEDYLGQLILRRALKYYESWDGVNYEISATKGYSRARLVIGINYNRLTNKIDFKHFRIFTKKGIPENSRMKLGDTEIKDVKLISEHYSSPIDIKVSLNDRMDLIDSANRIKYSFKPQNFYIFKKHPEFNEWIQIPKVEYNVGTTFIITKKEFFENRLKSWFDKIDSGQKKLLDNNQKTGLPDGWLAFLVDTITKYPHPEIKDLAPDAGIKPKINFDKSFYYNGQFFAGRLPEVWIENAEADENLVVYALYEDNIKIPLERKCKEQGFFVFTDEHIKRQDSRFKLVSGGIETKRYYQIVDFKKKTNEEIELLLPVRNETGQVIYSNPENYLRGIEPFFSQSKVEALKPLQAPLHGIDMFIKGGEAGNLTLNFEYNNLHPGNILINYLSTKDKVYTQDFDKAVFSLLKERKEEDIQKKANYLRYSLQDAGFIDYDIQNGKITVNKPHLIVKPSEKGIVTFLTGARDNNFIGSILKYCKQNNITVEVKDDIEKLHPQTIYIKFKKPDFTSAKKFAQQFDLVFKKYDLYTQFSLASFFPDISNWRQFIQKVENEVEDFPGGAIFDIETLAFRDKPEDFDKKLAFTKYTNINGYKTVYRLWYDEVAYLVEEQQLGIYIYLYLYKKIAEDEYNKCKEAKGWLKCGELQEKMESAAKQTNIVIYDKEKKCLAVPLNCRLPRNLSISLALLNGQKPEIKYLQGQKIREGLYIVYRNVPSLFLTNTVNLHLLKKGLQSLNETTINIEL